MKAVFAVGFALIAAGISRGGPPDDAILAAMKVSELPNYSWTTKVWEEAFEYEIEGRTQKGGCTWVKLPMVPGVARRLGRDAEARIEAVFDENARCVIRTAEGWKRLEDLPRCHDDWIEDPAGLPRSGRWLATLPLLGGSPTGAIRTTLRDDRATGGYSHAQFGVSHPHAELAIIVCSSTDLQVQGDRVAGTLTDIGAQLLLVRDGQDQIKPLSVAGTFQLWLKDGLVVRYTLELEGILKVDRRKVHVRQTSKTVLRDIAATKAKIPEEALLRLQW